MPTTCKDTHDLKRKAEVKLKFNDTLIQQLVERRYSMGLSQQYVEHVIGIGHGLIAKWETGLRKPSGFLLYCWVEALKCELRLVPKK